MRRALVGLGVAAVAMLLALALPALATHTSPTDPNDTRGRLDVRAVRFEHESGPPSWRFVMFSGWTVREVWDVGYLVVQLDTRGDPEVDYFMLVRSDGAKLVGTLYRVRENGTQATMGTVAAGKSGPRRATVSVALHKLTVGSFRTSYFWSAITSLSASSCPRTCIDRIPDEGMVEQPLPGVTPTPTPTPTTTPSPSPSPSPS